ncbi:SulP family inorganic anion transporter [Maribacter spongiicola]|uniref:SulP family inorganic anion transporter n=1 Tax=Maribacter spongiicola TaxID=1206753 RepID=UPI0010602752|nr:SulP family inorganic anion transporter [Maribacter spongiicola]
MGWDLLLQSTPTISVIIAADVSVILVVILSSSNVSIRGPGNGLVILLLGVITTIGSDLYAALFTLAAIVYSGILMFFEILKMGRLADFFPASAIEGMLASIGLKNH